MAVQLSVWEAVYGNLAYTGDNEIVRELYDRILKNPLETLGFWDKAFVVAVSGTHQDQLVPNPVPEPGTMMLMGTSLIGLGVFGRRKIKK